ncbi:MAG TPA: chain length determinant protein EpsF [Usitatibacter sp.]|jgi:chain length determinant protein EpsF|nr:chain length determinant protein EpsF [Usitatibacter sp.]
MTIKQFLLALRGRLWIFLALLGGTILAAVVVSLMLPKTYMSTVSLFVDNADQQTLAGQPQDPRQRIGYMQTQVDLIQSPRVARKVVEDLRLGQSAAAKAAFAKSGARGDIEDWIASNLLLGLKVDTTQSSVITVTYSANDPRFAAAAANAFAKAYIDVTLSLRTEPNKQAAAWFDDQLKSLRTQLDSAQQKLAEYQREHGIIATDERMDVESQKLQELSNQQLRANDEMYGLAGRSGVAGRAGDTSPEVLANPLVQALKTDLLRAEAQLQELSTRVGPRHPQYIQQKAQVDALRARVAAESNRIVGGARNATAASAAREAALKRDLERQRQRVIELRDARAQASTLMRDVDTAQKAYEAALQRYLVNKVESGARMTNVNVLSPAVEPSRPAKPKVTLNIALGLILGLCLGMGAVFLLELMDRRVRSADDLVVSLGPQAPLLGTLKPWRPAGLLGGPGGNTRALPSPT